MINEVWKDVEGFEDLYQISNCGNVKNKKRNKLLIPKIKEDDYLFVGLYKGTDPTTKRKIYKNFYISRLVAIHFISNPKNKLCVNHIDGIKSHNYESNLEWATHSENIIHKHRILHKGSGFDNYASKLNENKLSEIRRLLINDDLTQREIGKLFGISSKVISTIKTNRKYKYV